jgi:hypothetical protein
MLCCSGCVMLTEIPELPPNLDYLHADDLPCVCRLPELSSRGYNAIYINDTGIVELPDPLPCIDDFSCSNARIRRLPVMSNCNTLDISGCKRLQQLAEPLPTGLAVMLCSGCTALQQLPPQLPAGLQTLRLCNCTALQQLPDLAGSDLHELRITGCSGLREVRAGGCRNLVVCLD